MWIEQCAHPQLIKLEVIAEGLGYAEGEFHVTKNTLAITANTPEVGEAKETIAINYKGADINIAFNPAYMMDPLKALSDLDEVFLELTDELSPGVLKINGAFLYVIMPMRI